MFRDHQRIWRKQLSSLRAAQKRERAGVLGFSLVGWVEEHKIDRLGQLGKSLQQRARAAIFQRKALLDAERMQVGAQRFQRWRAAFRKPHIPGTPAESLDANRPGTRIQINESGPGQARRKNVEQRFPQPVGGGARRRTRRRLQKTGSKGAGNHAHPPMVNAGRGLRVAGSEDYNRPMGSWSFPVGRVFGVEVRMHLVFPLLLLLAMFWAGALGRGVARGVMLWALLVLAVLVRETARALLAAGFGMDLKGLLLLPTGGVETFRTAAGLARAGEPRVQRFMALVGPASNLLFGLTVAGMVLTASPGVDLRTQQWVTPLHLLKAMVWLNLLLGALNLLPAWPLDAGRLMPGRPQAAGRKIPSLGIGIGPGIALALVGIGIALLNFWLIMAGIGVFLMAQIEQGGAADALEPQGERMKVREVMLTEYSILSASATLEDAVEQARHTLQDVFPVVRAGNLVGAVARRDVMAALEANGNGYVQGMMTRSLEPAGADEVLVEALGRASGAGSQLVPVLEGERVVGILTPGNLQRAMGLSALQARVNGRRAAEDEQD